MKYRSGLPEVIRLKSVLERTVWIGQTFTQKQAYRVKHLLEGRLSQRNYNTRMDEPTRLLKTLNKFNGLGMPEYRQIDQQRCQIG